MVKGPIALLILGDGTFAVETLDIAEAIGGWKVIGFLNSLLPADPDRRQNTQAWNRNAA